MEYICKNGKTIRSFWGQLSKVMFLGGKPGEKIYCVNWFICIEKDSKQLSEI